MRNSKIEGVKIKSLKILTDDRGFLMEILRSDDKIFKKFGQVYITSVKQGVAKAWHYHKKQTDNFVCVQGCALVLLYDNRKRSSTFGQIEEFILESPPKAKNPLLIQIPSGVLHGFTALNCGEAKIVNIPTEKYNYKNPDEYRLVWNDPEIPYHWPKEVKRGG